MPATAAFRHEAIFYAGPEAFLDRVAPFVVEGVAAGEPVMVALAAPKLDALRRRLGADADAGGVRRHGRHRPQPGLHHPRVDRLRRRALRPDARRRRADLARAQPRRARRVPVPRGAAQQRVRRCRGLPPRLPLRRGPSRPRGDRRGGALPPVGRRHGERALPRGRGRAAAVLRAARRRARRPGRAPDRRATRWRRSARSSPSMRGSAGLSEHARGRFRPRGSRGRHQQPAPRRR